MDDLRATAFRDHYHYQVAYAYYGSPVDDGIDREARAS
jgi:hypothetical protein